MTSNSAFDLLAARMKEGKSIPSTPNTENNPYFVMTEYPPVPTFATPRSASSLASLESTIRIEVVSFKRKLNSRHLYPVVIALEECESLEGQKYPLWKAFGDMGIRPYGLTILKSGKLRLEYRTLEQAEHAVDLLGNDAGFNTYS